MEVSRAQCNVVETVLLEDPAGPACGHVATPRLVDPDAWPSNRDAGLTRSICCERERTNKLSLTILRQAVDDVAGQFAIRRVPRTARWRPPATRG